MKLTKLEQYVKDHEHMPFWVMAKRIMENRPDGFPKHVTPGMCERAFDRVLAKEQKEKSSLTKQVLVPGDPLYREPRTPQSIPKPKWYQQAQIDEDKRATIVASGGPILASPDPLLWSVDTNEPFTPDDEEEPTKLFYVKAQDIDEALAKAKRAIAGHVVTVIAVSLV